MAVRPVTVVVSTDYFAPSGCALRQDADVLMRLATARRPMPTPKYGYVLPTYERRRCSIALGTEPRVQLHPPGQAGATPNWPLLIGRNAQLGYIDAYEQLHFGMLVRPVLWAAAMGAYLGAAIVTLGLAVVLLCAAGPSATGCLLFVGGGALLGAGMAAVHQAWQYMAAQTLIGTLLELCSMCEQHERLPRAGGMYPYDAASLRQRVQLSARHRALLDAAQRSRDALVAQAGHDCHMLLHTPPEAWRNTQGAVIKPVRPPAAPPLLAQIAPIQLYCMPSHLEVPDRIFPRAYTDETFWF